MLVYKGLIVYIVKRERKSGQLSKVPVVKTVNAKRQRLRRCKRRDAILSDT